MTIAPFVRGQVSLPEGVHDTPCLDKTCEERERGAHSSFSSLFSLSSLCFILLLPLLLQGLEQRLLRPMTEVEKLRSTPGSLQETFMDSAMKRRRTKCLEFAKDLDVRGLFRWDSDSGALGDRLRAEEEQSPANATRLIPPPPPGPLRERRFRQDRVGLGRGGGR